MSLTCLPGYKQELMFESISDETTREENLVKLLGILIDSDLTFNNHTKMIRKEASQKLTGISRFSYISSESKRMILLKTFFELIDFTKGLYKLCTKTMYQTFINF